MYIGVDSTTVLSRPAYNPGMNDDPAARVPSPSADESRLHICVGYACNNRCIFCTEDDRMARHDLLVGQTDEDVRRMMLAEPRSRDVMFTSGEPTLHPRLPAWIGMAREIGFETIGLITNGRKLAYRAFTRRLVEAGLNHVLVSIHGHDARTHDALTRTQGAFVQTLAGLANLALLKRKYPLKVHTAFVVNKRNFRYLREFVEAMRPFDVDQHVFNLLMPDGGGLVFFDQLMPRYSDVAAEFADLVARLPPEDVERMFLLDAPLCTTEGLPARVRGYVERYFHFEPDRAPLYADVQDQTSAAGPDAGEVTFRRAALEIEGNRFSKVAKSLTDSLVRVFRPECDRCRHRPACRGVEREYVERFGWDEFVPVSDEPPPRGGR